MSRLSAAVLISLMIAVSGAGRSAAQQTIFSSKQTEDHHATLVRAVSIRFVAIYGFGCDCYCGAEIQVRPDKATLNTKPTHRCQQRDSQKYRPLRVDADLSSKHWQELEQLVNHDALFALPDMVPCPGCSGDQGSKVIQVEFSDHTKKSVRYLIVPNEIAALSGKLSALEAKLENELPPWWSK